MIGERIASGWRDGTHYALQQVPEAGGVWPTLPFRVMATRFHKSGAWFGPTQIVGEYPTMDAARSEFDEFLAGVR